MLYCLPKGITIEGPGPEDMWDMLGYVHEGEACYPARSGPVEMLVGEVLNLNFEVKISVSVESLTLTTARELNGDYLGSVALLDVSDLTGNLVVIVLPCRIDELMESVRSDGLLPFLDIVGQIAAFEGKTAIIAHDITEAIS